MTCIDINGEEKVQKQGKCGKPSLRKWCLSRDLNKICKILPDKREEKAFQAEGTIGKV